MPMDVGYLVAEKFIVDLNGVKHLRERDRRLAHFVNHAVSLICR
jgi:hypothetical protein